ncbi:MAG: hypothetical protein HY941_05895 [Gammaproteobacteria bacterium]|nr:hypothetical protein [Gammaproteobacteria bacterium]
MTIEIVEVLRRSQQGLTRPYICRGDDGETYFVKGTGAGRRSQICEWIAGRLALELGLPIAPFEIVHVPEELLELEVSFDLSDLGAGPAFGSRDQRGAELTATLVMEVPAAVQQDVLVFDWWVRNGDRSLTEKGGNPNLFWRPEARELVVIDHNQAFDTALTKAHLLEYHVFRDQAHQVFGDFVSRRDYNAKLAAALTQWPDICSKLPREWHYVDPEMTVSVDFDLNVAHELLMGHDRDEFWNWI